MYDYDVESNELNDLLGECVVEGFITCRECGLHIDCETKNCPECGWENPVSEMI